MTLLVSGLEPFKGTVCLAATNETYSTRLLRAAHTLSCNKLTVDVITNHQ